MSKEDKQSLIAIPLSVLIAIGLAWAGSQGGYTVAGTPIFTLVVAIAFIIQWLAFIPAYWRRTQAFYDLIGSLTNITVILISVLLTPAADSRAWLLAGLITIWAGRLGYFLVSRIRLDGEDRRFREIKLAFLRYLLAWTMQGLWVSFTLAAALAAITPHSKLRWISLPLPDSCCGWLASRLKWSRTNRKETSGLNLKTRTSSYVQGYGPGPGTLIILAKSCCGSA